jgi:hypothetical protein
MTTTRTRVLVVLCGILGTAALGVYFGAAPPLPPADASVAQVASAATQYHDQWLLGAWIQAMGALLSVVFFVALVHLAGGAARLAGSLTFIGSAVLLAVTLIEGAFTIAIAEAAANGHAATALSSYDLMGVFIYIYPLAPAPLILLPLGAVLLGSRLLPRAFSYLALGLGIAYLIVGFAGLFTTPLLTLVVLSLQSVWVVAAAIALVFRKTTAQASLSSVLAQTD